MQSLIDKAAALLKDTHSLFVLTGAGISAESGIPTFRGADGLWKNYSATDLATYQAFVRNPRLVWEWYEWRQAIISKAEPNPAHYAVAELEKCMPEFLLLTQNVDDLHARAGSKRILQLHGNIFRTRCMLCHKTADYGYQYDRPSDVLPRCTCGGLLRPDVVWFGETIPRNIWQHALTFLDNTDVALICGTSGVVWPAAAIPEIAKKNGVKTIEVNLELTPASSLVDIAIQGKAGDILAEIVKALT